MSGRILHLAAASALLVTLTPPVHGQRVQTRFEDEPEGESLAIEITKWSAGALALAAGAWAFGIQHDAEDAMDELDAFCTTSPASCVLSDNGEYQDPAVESRYQDIRGDYRNSRWLLLGAHVLAATSVVLFIVDLPRNPTPDNIPYDPAELRVGARPHGGFEASIRYPVSNIFTRSP